MAISAPYLIAAPPNAAGPVTGALLPMHGSCSARTGEDISVTAAGRAKMNLLVGRKCIIEASNLSSRS